MNFWSEQSVCSVVWERKPQEWYPASLWPHGTCILAASPRPVPGPTHKARPACPAGGPQPGGGGPRRDWKQGRKCFTWRTKEALEAGLQRESPHHCSHCAVRLAALGRSGPSYPAATRTRRRWDTDVKPLPAAQAPNLGLPLIPLLLSCRTSNPHPEYDRPVPTGLTSRATTLIQAPSFLIWIILWASCVLCFKPWNYCPRRNQRDLVKTNMVSCCPHCSKSSSAGPLTSHRLKPKTHSPIVACQHPSCLHDRPLLFLSPRLHPSPSLFPAALASSWLLKLRRRWLFPPSGMFFPQMADGSPHLLQRFIQMSLLPLLVSL